MERVGRYEVRGELGRGGMGLVLRAYDPQLDREVALKLILDGAADPRFALEARAICRLRHPGIVAMLDVGRDERGRDYLALELVEGESLQARLEREGPLPLEEVLRIGRQLSQALAHAHAQGVLHRDLKPHNVLLGADGEAKLTDFGLARLADQSQAFTQTGEVLGTPAFMAPEQARGDRSVPGPATDVYGLGATLYALLTGAPPFRASSLVSLLQAVLERQPQPPSELRPGVPPALEAVVLRCLAKDPAQRYPSAEALDRALAEAGGPRRGAAPRRAAAALVLAGLVAAALLLGLAPRRPEAAARPAASPAPAPPADPREAHLMDLLNRAADAYAAGEAPAAFALFDQAVAAAPDRLEPWVARGLTRFVARDLPGSLADLDRAAEIAPERVLTFTARARVRHDLGDLAGALQDLDRAVQLDPDLCEGWNGRGAYRAEAGDLEGALSDLDRAVQLDPDNFDALVSRARLLARLLRWEEAEATLSRVLELRPDEPFYLLQRAKARSVLHDDAGTLADLDRLVELKPGGEVWLRRSALRQRLGDLAGALADAEEAVRADPERADPFLQRAYLRADRDDVEGAMADASRAVELAPRAPGAWMMRASVWVRRGRGLEGEEARRAFTQALSDLNQALALRPEDAQALSWRGLARSFLGDLPGALADLDRSVALNPDNPSSRNARSETRERAGDLAGALEDLERSLELTPLEAQRQKVAAKIAELRQRLGR